MGALEDVMGKKVIELVERAYEEALAKEKECFQAGSNTVQGIGYTFSYPHVLYQANMCKFIFEKPTSVYQS